MADKLVSAAVFASDRAVQAFPLGGRVGRVEISAADPRPLTPFINPKTSVVMLAIPAGRTLYIGNFGQLAGAKATTPGSSCSRSPGRASSRPPSSTRTTPAWRSLATTTSPFPSCRPPHSARSDHMLGFVPLVTPIPAPVFERLTPLAENARPIYTASPDLISIKPLGYTMASSIAMKLVDLGVVPGTVIKLFESPGSFDASKAVLKRSLAVWADETIGDLILLVTGASAGATSETVAYELYDTPDDELGRKSLRFYQRDAGKQSLISTAITSGTAPLDGIPELGFDGHALESTVTWASADTDHVLSGDRKLSAHLAEIDARVFDPLSVLRGVRAHRNGATLVSKGAPENGELVVEAESEFGYTAFLTIGPTTTAADLAAAIRADATLNPGGPSTSIHASLDQFGAFVMSSRAGQPIRVGSTLTVILDAIFGSLPD